MHRAIVSSIARRGLNATAIPGDGVGPEIVKSSQQVLAAANVPIEFETQDISEVGKRTANFSTVVESINRSRVCLKGPLISDESYQATNMETLNFKLHTKLDLFATVSVCKSI